MVVGRAAVGKTSLVRALCHETFDANILSTDGIDIGSFSVEDVRFVCWDFAAQTVYRYTHQLFLTPNAIYLVLFKIRDGNRSETLNELRFWLHSIAARTANAAQVLLVGTHLDQVGNISEATRDALFEIYAPLSREFPRLFPIDSDHKETVRLKLISSAPGGQDTINTLCDSLLQLAAGVKIRVSSAVLRVQSFLESTRLDLESHNPPVVPMVDLISVWQAFQATIQERKFRQIMDALANIGAIFVHAPNFPLWEGFIVLRPQWIARLLCSIITTRHRYVQAKSATISLETLQLHIWNDKHTFPPTVHGHMIDLLIQLEVLFPQPQFGDPSLSPLYFIPSMLPEEPPDLTFIIPSSMTQSTDAVHLSRVIQLTGDASLPIGVLPPVLIHLMEVGELRSRWQQGCVAYLSREECWCQVMKKGSKEIHLTVFGHSIAMATKILRLVTTTIDNRLTEFYHLPFDIQVVYHPGQASGLEEFQSLHLKGQWEFRCGPSCALCPLQLVNVVPDVLLADISAEQQLIDWQHLTKGRKLGQGSFGTVMQAELIRPSSSPSQVAVKTIPISSAGSSVSPKNTLAAFAEFQQEVLLMSALRNSNIVQIIGICLHPPAIVMELVTGGDLAGQLTDPSSIHAHVDRLTQAVDKALVGYARDYMLYTSKNVKWIFEHRLRLAPSTRTSIDLKFTQLYQALSPESDLSTEEILIRIDQRWIAHNMMDSMTHAFNRLHYHTALGLDDCDLLPLLPPKPSFDQFAVKKQSACHQSFERRRAEILRRLPADVAQSMASEITSTETELMQSIQSRYSKEEQSKDDHLREKLAIDRLIKLEREHRDILVPITWPLRLKLALDICSGLCYMHELRPPILHRDLKSPNIFLTRSLVGIPQDVSFLFNPEATPLAKVADFGLSIRLMGSDQLRVTTVDSPMANINPIWAAPEVLSRSEYSRAADVYAMGLILWELLVRERPFYEVPTNLLPRVLVEKIIEGHRPAVPPHLKTDPLASEYIRLMEQCWAPNPLSRPTIRSVKDALLLFAQVNLGVQTSQLIRAGSSSSPSHVSQ